MGVEGLDIASADLLTLFVNAAQVFVVMNCGDDVMQVFRGRTIAREQMFARHIRSLDLTEKLRPVLFRLAGDREPLFVDRRLLIARSMYFQAMFGSGCRESQTDEVDLRGDLGVGHAEMDDVLRYVVSDAYLPTDDSVEHMFKVRALADRYQFQGLQILIEERLLPGLTSENVLLYLRRAFGSDGPLEQECWRVLADQGYDVLEDHAATLVKIAVESPELASAIMLRGRDFGSTRKRRRTARNGEHT
jgi:hypothetical protein